METNESPQPIKINEPTNSFWNNDNNDIDLNTPNEDIDEYYLDEPPNIHVDSIPNISNSSEHVATIIEHQLSSPIICKCCNKDFNNLTTYYDHKLKNNPCLRAIQNCEICDVDHEDNNNNKTRAHISNHLLRQKYFCKHCNQYENASMIEQYNHLMEMYGVKPNICIKCRNTFTNRQQLWNHIRMKHKQLSKFITKKESCEPIIKRKRIDTTTSTNVQPSIMKNSLNATTTNSDVIGQSILISYSCSECKITFNCESEMVAHRINVHKKKFRCKKCGIVTTNIMDHISQHRQCFICKIAFNSAIELNEHELKKH